MLHDNNMHMHMHNNMYMNMWSESMRIPRDGGC